MDLTCSSCGKLVVGTATVLGEAPEFEGQMEWGDLELYHGLTETGSYTNYTVLHPNCMHQVIDEILRQEGQAAMLLVVGQVTDVKDALGIPT